MPLAGCSRSLAPGREEGMRKRERKRKRGPPRHEGGPTSLGGSDTEGHCAACARARPQRRGRGEREWAMGMSMRGGRLLGAQEDNLELELGVAGECQAGHRRHRRRAGRGWSASGDHRGACPRHRGPSRG
ncbi:hypothetical protein H696_04812 [Fonticula alba]|uniref:Uncharacterized protein n=1 Tax=Fonticula alba TaxID=691883 RepID=A0A058Z2Q5_FONAL|nr:hypothetical protein H696_04812 [Fonticula alba]KCV68520.1 hypothetical protein H696_04812 [Fonticula alba]|eukprot:XP_009496952.1 hypothetical protein H696_04812 [Fonticula alba]